MTADATDSARLSDLTKGAVALYNCASPLYHQWFTDWPPLHQAPELHLYMAWNRDQKV